MSSERSLRTEIPPFMHLCILHSPGPEQNSHLSISWICTNSATILLLKDEGGKTRRFQTICTEIKLRLKMQWLNMEHWSFSRTKICSWCQQFIFHFQKEKNRKPPRNFCLSLTLNSWIIHIFNRPEFLQKLSMQALPFGKSEFKTFPSRTNYLDSRQAPTLNRIGLFLIKQEALAKTIISG